MRRLLTSICYLSVTLLLANCGATEKFLNVLFSPANADLILSTGEVDFGTVTVHQIVVRKVTLTNIGKRKAKIVGAKIVGNAGPSSTNPFKFRRGIAFPGFQGECDPGLVLEILGKCSFYVQFIPTQMKSYTDVVKIQYRTQDTANEPSEISLGLKGAAMGDASLFFSLDGVEPVQYDGNKPFNLGTFVRNHTTVLPVTVLYGGIAPALDVSFQILPKENGSAQTEFSFNTDCPMQVTGTCALALTALNATAGPFTVTIRAQWYSGSTLKSENLRLSGTVTNEQVAASVSIQGLPGGWPGRLVLGPNALENIATTPLQLRYDSGSLPASQFRVAPFQTAAFSVADFSCLTLSGGQVCNFKINFTPGTQTGVYNDRLKILYFNGGGETETTVNLTGRALTPAILKVTEFASSTSLNEGSPAIAFGEGTLNYPRGPVKTFVVQWNGATTGTNSGPISISMPNHFVVDNGNCAGASLGPETGVLSCSFTARFFPTGTAPPSPTGSITVGYNDGRQNQAISFSVGGTTSYWALLEFDPNPLEFPDTVETLFRTMPYSNLRYYGREVATVTQVSGGIAPFALEPGYPGTPLGNCPLSISSGSCIFNVTFRPTVPGNFSATGANAFSVKYNRGDGTIRAANLDVTGKGVSRANLAIVGGISTINFGNVVAGNFGTQTMTLQNTGGYVATLNSPFPAFDPLANNPFTRSGGTCGATLASGDTCTIEFRFSPVAVHVNVNVQNGVKLTYDNGISTVNLSATLQGRGTGEAQVFLSVLQAPATAVVGGRATAFSVQLQYYGIQSITLQSASFTGSEFGFVGGSFPGSAGTAPTVGSAYNNVSPGWMPKTIQGLFLPSAAGLRSSTLTLTFNVAGTPMLVQQGINGTGAAPAQLSLSTPATVNTNVNSPKAFDISVSKSGGVAAEAVTPSALTGPFRFLGSSFPGTGSNCGTQITGPCNLKLEYAPTAGGAHNTPLQLTYKDGTVDANGVDNIRTTNSISIQGQATTAANLLLSAANNGNFQKIPRASALVTTTVLVSNIGTQAASVQAASISAPFSVVSQNCSTLAPSANCQIVVGFQSNIPGAYQSTLQVPYSDTNGPKSASNDFLASSTVPVSIAVGYDHTCAITDIAKVKCWGLNDRGQLGLGLPVSGNPDANARIGRPSNQEIQELANVDLGLSGSVYPVEIAAGNKFTCVRTSVNKVRCWGDNQFGQLGGGYTVGMIGRSPADMGGALNAHEVPLPGTPETISLGFAHACSLLTDKSISCWGYNQDGQLGIGSNVNINGIQTLARTNIGITALKVEAGESHTCAKTSDSRLKCWGQNTYRQLGLSGAMNSRGTLPAEMGTALPYVGLPTGNANVLDFDVGGGFTVVVMSDGRAYAWGYNKESGNLGRLFCQNAEGAIGVCNASEFINRVDFYGDGPTQMGSNLQPISIGTNVTAKAVATGNSHTCLILSNDNLKCFGGNFGGQLGLGDTTDRGALFPVGMGDQLPLVALGSGLRVKTVQAGNKHTCAILSDNSTKCWGDNASGQIGYKIYPSRGTGPNEMGDALTGLVFY